VESVTLLKLPPFLPRTNKLAASSLKPWKRSAKMVLSQSKKAILGMELEFVEGMQFDRGYVSPYL